jgi:hypothetical protein
MAAPVWTTPAGNLGTIQEQTFYELVMIAYDPEDPTEGDLGYKIVAGALPPGLVMYENGSIQGQPRELYYIRGVPFDVKQDVTSTFCCRAINKRTGQVTDRTFSITVTGEDAPQITTNAGSLGTFIDGTEINIQLEAVDLDSEPISWALVKGELPAGLTLDTNTGLISGYLEPQTLLDLSGNIGWSADAAWEEVPWDFNARSMSRSYQFDIQAFDGKSYDGAIYTIRVISKDSLTADNDTELTSDGTLILADMDIKRNPVLLTKAADLGTYAHDNYFAYQFKGRDFDGDVISYSLLLAEDVGFENEVSGFDSTLFDASDFSLPPGLVINTDTGWMYGQIPRQAAGQQEYTFAVRVYKRDYPAYQSTLTFFTLTIVNDLKFAITWNTAADLGSLQTGNVSEKYVSASNAAGRTLIYSLYSGSLPQGLRLNPDGLIVGRSSYELTSFDSGTTTFDKDVRSLGFLSSEMTIDRKYTFTIKASDANAEMVGYRTFSITMDPGAFEPSEDLYLRAQPGIADKETIQQILRNSDVIPVESIYRNSDPYFGRSRDLRMLLMASLKASNATDYIQAMATNHYRKQLKLGDYKWAQALNADGTVAYEVVYIAVNDDQSKDGISVAESINLANKIKRDTSVDATNLDVSNMLSSMDGSGDKIVYPNSLFNMRRVIKAGITQNVQEALPRWMTSKQPDGRILGWTPAVVIAYVNKDQGDKIVFRLNRLDSDVQIKDVSFDVDRYIWDNNLSKNYDATTGVYNTSAETTFDRELRQVSGDVDFSFQGDGSTIAFDIDIDTSIGTISVYLEQDLIIDGNTIKDRSLQISPDDYEVNGSLVTLTSAPGVGVTVIILYRGPSNLVADYALEVPFSYVDGRTQAWIEDTLEGLDGIIENYVGKKVIFAVQEDYSGFTGEYDGWVRYDKLWDDSTGWDDPANGWDEYEIIPGYSEAQDGSTVNQRSAIWTIVEGESGELRLELDRAVGLGATVAVRNGAKYGGYLLRYGPNIIFYENETVPRYRPYSALLEAIETTFDDRATRFIESISVYQEPDEGDKYLAFPRVNIWA